MIKRVIFKIGSILEYLTAINLCCGNKIEGHRSAETLLLGGKFINFVHNY